MSYPSEKQSYSQPQQPLPAFQPYHDQPYQQQPYQQQYPYQQQQPYQQHQQSPYQQPRQGSPQRIVYVTTTRSEAPLQMILFICGFVCVIAWFVGNCVPAKSPSEIKFQRLNRIFACLSCMLIIAVITAARTQRY